MLISREDEQEYLYALESFKNCFGISPKVFLTDKEDALRNAISVVFPEAKNLLCIWHINKNILKNCLNKFYKREQFDNFMKYINQLLQSSTETISGPCVLEYLMVHHTGRLQIHQSKTVPIKWR
jgi:transposase-like protein